MSPNSKASAQDEPRNRADLLKLTKRNLQLLEKQTDDSSSRRSYCSSFASFSICSSNQSLCNESDLTLLDDSKSVCSSVTTKSRALTEVQASAPLTVESSINFKMSMLVLFGAGIAAFTGFLYNIPIQRKADLITMEKGLREQVFCQDSAIDQFMEHLKFYTAKEHEGPVLLFLTGNQGVGKTFILNKISHVNPSWPLVVATHEEGRFDQMNGEEFLAHVHKHLYKSLLNIVAFDDLGTFDFESKFVQEKFLPTVHSLSRHKHLVFVVVTLSNDQVPKSIKDEFVHHFIRLENLNKTCVELCATELLQSLNYNASDYRMDDLLKGIEFVTGDKQLVSVTGCKAVSKTVAVHVKNSKVQKDSPQE